ncbi:MAG TPA: hemolysin family protein [Pseudonocardia sp.]|jgi:CBS domain containing-hemolysin-like protein|nr:hemolysin family protein [Pseudonocardia sp.]
MSEILAMLASVVLLLGNAFFVAAEFAVISARKDRLSALAEGGSVGAQATLRAGEHLPLLIAGAQLGITLCSLGLGRLAEPAVAGLLERPFRLVGLPDSVLHPLAFALGLGVVAMLHTIIGEMVPKNLAIAGPERAAVLLVPGHHAFCRLVAPVLAVLTAAATVVLRLFRVTPREEFDAAYTQAEVAEMIAESRREGLLDEQESSRIVNTLGSAGRSVADVMVPADRVVTLPVSATVGEVSRSVAEHDVSRFPLRDDSGRLVGYLHVKDLLAQADDSDAVVQPAQVRGLPELPGDARLVDGLAALRRSRAQLARVVATTGGETIGVVSLDELVRYYIASGPLETPRPRQL